MPRKKCILHYKGYAKTHENIANVSKHGWERILNFIYRWINVPCSQQYAVSKELRGAYDLFIPYTKKHLNEKMNTNMGYHRSCNMLCNFYKQNHP